MLPKIWFDIRNLQKISFPVRLIRFLPTRHLHGQKSARRQPIFMHFLSGFSAYSGQPVDRFRWNLVRSEIKWTQSRRKRLQVNIFSHFEDIQAQSRQKRPKIDQNLWMIQILVENFFIAFLESRDFNSCKKRIKKFSTRFSLYDVIMAPDLENFSTENFSTKKNFFEVFKWLNSKSYNVKSEIESKDLKF